MGRTRSIDSEGGRRDKYVQRFMVEVGNILMDTKWQFQIAYHLTRLDGLDFSARRIQWKCHFQHVRGTIKEWSDWDSPRLAVVLPTWPNKFVSGSQKTRSKHRMTLLRFPKPSRLIAVCFHSGSGGSKQTVFSWRDVSSMAILRTPSVSVDKTMSAVD